MTETASAPLGGMAPSAFLAAQWQKRPKLIRAALPGWRSPLTPDELAGLACEEAVESRLVTRRGARWRVAHGPFTETDFARLPKRDWTLLVQGVDRWVPEVAALLARFRFVPDWRRDDVMVSYAPPGGGVGPHVDAYDVFLLQGEGRRLWRLGDRALTDPAWIPGQPLKLLADFEPAEEHVLEPGDMLYVPPGWAHDGVAVDASLTFSIGFRAPSAADLAGRFAAALAEQPDEGDRYADPDLTPPQDPSELPPAAIERVRALLRRHLDDDAFLAGWLGRLLTEPKEERLPRRRRRPAGPLRLAADARLAWTRAPGSSAGTTLTLFADGTAFPSLTGEAATLARQLCRAQGDAAPVLSATARAALAPEAATLVDALLAAGTLEPA